MLVDACPALSLPGNSISETRNDVWVGRIHSLARVDPRGEGKICDMEFQPQTYSFAARGAVRRTWRLFTLCPRWRLEEFIGVYTR